MFTDQRQYRGFILETLTKTVQAVRVVGFLGHDFIANLNTESRRAIYLTEILDRLTMFRL